MYKLLAMLDIYNNRFYIWCRYNYAALPFCWRSTNESYNRMNYKDVKKAVYSWGYYPALVYLQECEAQERYEDCAIIKSVLDDFVKGGI